MAKPGGTTQPVATPAAPVQNPETTVGLAPADQPINNSKPNMGGKILPSVEDTAIRTPSVAEHDKQPVSTHTFNFTAEQKKKLVDALAQEKGAPAKTDFAPVESVVLPDGVELKPLPDRVAQEMPWVARYKYAKIGNKIVLANPAYRYTVGIIE